MASLIPDTNKARIAAGHMFRLIEHEKKIDSLSDDGTKVASRSVFFQVLTMPNVEPEICHHTMQRSYIRLSTATRKQRLERI